MTTLYLRKSIGRSPWALAVCLAMLGLGLSATTNDRRTTFTTFDAPGAGTGPGQGTLAFSINPAGATTGIVRDANIVRHGFVRAANGAITTFDVAGAGTGPFQGTRGNNINPAGAIAGFSTDANDVTHGFVRASNGAITTFDAPG